MFPLSPHQWFWEIFSEAEESQERQDSEDKREDDAAGEENLDIQSLRAVEGSDQSGVGNFEPSNIWANSGASKWYLKTLQWHKGWSLGGQIFPNTRFV